MLTSTEQVYGRVKTQIYTFSKAGDVLPEHDHDNTTVHFTVVCRGKLLVKCLGHSREISAGEVIDFNPGHSHEITALEDNSRLINVRKFDFY